MAFDRRWILDGSGSLSAVGLVRPGSGTGVTQDAAAGATPASDSLAAS